MNVSWVLRLEVSSKKDYSPKHQEAARLIFYLWNYLFCTSVFYMEKKIIQWLRSFFLSHFLSIYNSLLMSLCSCPSCDIFTLLVYQRSESIESFQFSENLYGKTEVEDFPNFRRPEVYHQDVISKNKLNTPETFNASRRTWLASELFACDGCLC